MNNECTQTVKLEKIENKIISLEKEDIKIQKDVEGLGEDVKDIKKIISAGFNKVLLVMGFIISILLTALGIMVYNFGILN